MYKNLSSEEKKKLKNKYQATKKGKALTDNLNRLCAEGFFCLGTCIVTLVFIFVYKLEWWYWFFVGLTLLCGLLFLIGQHLIRMREYNKFMQVNNFKKNKLTKKK